MDRFIKELQIGDIHRRDRWQFELKSEFSPPPSAKHNTFTEEFFLFIPNSLQINSETYTKTQFYLDRTNLIRYKTPELELDELYNQKNNKSPLSRLKEFINFSSEEIMVNNVIDELKLLGNVIRSSLRERVRRIDVLLRQKKQADSEIKALCSELITLRKDYFRVQDNYLSQWKVKRLKSYFFYLDEFFSNTINYYLTGLLSEIRLFTHKHGAENIQELCKILEKERIHREKVLHEPSLTDEDSKSNEFILYRSSLLNKFVLDALLLSTRGTTFTKKFQNIIGSISAGIAMLFFFVLFVWQGKVFIINSLPFIVITVFLYILKDRIKETIRHVSYQKFSRWFYDYKTEVRSPDDKIYLGKITETVSFVDEKKIPKKIQDIRHREFHDILETFKRPEKVIYYKKKISIKKLNEEDINRRHALNVIFRFNIQHFLNKADNPTHDYLKVDLGSFEFIRAKLPKVYHLNMIIRTTFLEPDLSKRIELKKFRLILNKNGIKRVEHIN